MKNSTPNSKSIVTGTDEILTIKELSLYLKINEKTIYKLAKQGKLPGVKIGGMWRFKKEAIDNWLMNPNSKNGGN